MPLPQKPSAACESRAFGQLPDSRTVEAWTLRGEGGLELEVITLGGIVTRLLAPDAQGVQADVVLGFDRLKDYLAPHPYFGAIIGRIAGRVPGGQISVEGKDVTLPLNDGANHLHGGPQALDKHLWAAEPVEREDGTPSLRLTCHSADGDQGYPGVVDYAVTYTVTHDNVFIFETEARADRPTPVSLTHHGYFNLAGEGQGDIRDHRVQIHCDTCVPADAAMTPLGRLESVRGTAADFTQPKRLREAIPGLWQEHGDLYWLGQSDSIRTVAVVEEPVSGRRMEVRTDLSCLQFYTGMGLDGTLTGKSGKPYGKFAALCLECEDYPGATTQPGFGDILARPGKPRRSVTHYAFSAS